MFLDSAEVECIEVLNESSEEFRLCKTIPVDVSHFQNWYGDFVHIRRTHHLFPVQPYISLPVDTLKNTDENVQCATPSVIELFTGPGVMDATRRVAQTSRKSDS
jgi:hypothetical protein